MLPRLCRACLILALVTSVGLHWALLQSAAWVSMVVAYSKDATVVEALEKTFDGEHPCSLCKMVEKGAATDSDTDKDRKEPAPKIQKMDFMLVSIDAVVMPPPGEPDFAPFTQRLLSQAAEVQTPPPRCGA